MGVRAVFAATGNGDIPPAGGRGFLGHFDDHLLLSFFCFSENTKSADILLSQNIGAWGDFGLGAVPFLKGDQKAYLLFQKGKNGWALDMVCEGLRGLCPFSADGIAKRAPVCWLWTTNKTVPLFSSIFLREWQCLFCRPLPGSKRAQAQNCPKRGNCGVQILPVGLKPSFASIV